MIFATHFFCVLLLAFGAQDTAKASTLSSLERLAAKVSVESVAPADISRLAGHYANPPTDLVRRIGGVLSGDDLYLFADGTFIYCQWSDIQPLTIYDKGQWTFANGDVELKSDLDVTWNPEADRTYIAVRRRSHRKEILLVGLRSDLAHFEREVRDDPESMLLIVSKERKAALTLAEGKKIKARLLRESWHPDDYKTKPTGPDKPHN
jgi:hypothetical protein